MSSMQELTTLSMRARAFDARLRRQGRRRLTLAELWEAFVALHPTAAADPDKRERLLEIVEELATAHRLTLPAPASWERVPAPALPRFVTLSATGTGPVRLRSLDFPWHPDLAWAATTQLGPAQRQFLEQVNQFLAAGGAHRQVVAIRERSLELCGDEKRLEELLDTALFAPGRLSPSYSGSSGSLSHSLSTGSTPVPGCLSWRTQPPMDRSARICPLREPSARLGSAVAGSLSPAWGRSRTCD